MDFKAFKKQLTRIERAYELLHKEGDITEVEIDLLRAYAKNLYDITLEGKEEAIVPEAPILKEKIVKEEAKIKANTQDPSEDAEFTTNDPKPKEGEKSSDSLKKDNAEILDLFKTKEAKELSDKLGISTVKNIEKSMSINEKILTTNDLFDGDNNAFKESLDKLDSFSAYPEAKSYLIEHVIKKYQWTDEKKKKKAKVFIDMVNRRFS